MLDIASFQGQRDVFGITTTGTEWKFHWLPVSNDCALSVEMPNIEFQNNILQDPLPELQREVYSTAPIPYNDPRLIPLLLSVVIKSKISPFYKVPLVSAKRVYIILSETGWVWARLKNNVVDLQKLTINVNGDVDNSTEFVVLNHLARKEDQLVWVALAGNTSRIVVIKQFLDSDRQKAERERDIWVNVNEGHAIVRTIRGAPSLIMPLVFHATFDSSGKPYIDCDLIHWLFPRGAIPDNLPDSLMQLRNELLTAAVPWETNIAEVARGAMSNLARHNVVHDDIEWRHFALMPRFNGKNVTDLNPVMIDFSLSHDVSSAQTAIQEMEPRVEALIAQSR